MLNIHYIVNNMFKPHPEITERIVKVLEQNTILTTREIAKRANTTRITAKKHLTRLVRDKKVATYRIGHSDAWTTIRECALPDPHLGGSNQAALQPTPNGVVADV